MNHEPPDPADPEYELALAEWYQQITDAPHQGDDDPLIITRRQAMKLAAIMDAVAHGYTNYSDALRAGSWFLACVIAEAHPHTDSSMTSTQVWERVEQWPWPRAGEPKPNIDD